MAITFANIPALGGAKNADVPTFTLSDFSEVGYTEEKGGLVKTRTYRLETGDPIDDTYVVVRREWNPKQGAEGTTYSSVRVLTDVEDSLLEVPLVGSYETLIAWNHPGKVILDTAQMLRFIGSAFAIVCGTFDGTTGAPAGVQLASMNFGGTKIEGAS